MRPASGAVSNAHGRAGAKHEPQLLGRHPPRADKGREEGRSDSEGRIHGGIQQDESCQRGRPEGIAHGFPAKLSRFLRLGTDARTDLSPVQTLIS